MSSKTNVRFEYTNGPTFVMASSVHVFKDVQIISYFYLFLYMYFKQLSSTLFLFLKLSTVTVRSNQPARKKERKRSSTHWPVAFCTEHTGIEPPPPPPPPHFYQNILWDQGMLASGKRWEIVNFQFCDFLCFNYKLFRYSSARIERD